MDRAMIGRVSKWSVADFGTISAKNDQGRQHDYYVRASWITDRQKELKPGQVVYFEAVEKVLRPAAGEVVKCAVNVREAGFIDRFRHKWSGQRLPEIKSRPLPYPCHSKVRARRRSQ